MIAITQQSATLSAPPPAPPPLPSTMAVVLAGGDGRRMGGSKPLRRLGATTLVSHAVTLARGYCTKLAVAVRTPDQLAGTIVVDLVFDVPGLEGPLGGLAAGLALARSRGAARLLTLPCDAPRLPRDLLSRLEAALEGDGPADAAVAASAGRLHPTCALWPVEETLAALRTYAASGGRSLRGLAGELCMAIVAWESDDADPFANANTPDELAALQPDLNSFGF